MIYAGIGSRQTPKDMLQLFQRIAKALAKKGYVLRSGGANGADLAFENGCNLAQGKKEIYLPWVGFNGNNSNLIVTDKRAFKMAEKYHPYWHNLKQGGRKLQARNCHQILGLDLKTPCDFVICYTKNGKGSGGTGQAIRIAYDYNIPVIDAGGFNNENDIIEAIKSNL